MSPSFNSFGSIPSVSQLVWDTDLIIPAGKAIESASGEVGINGDVSISGCLNTDGGISGGGNVTAAENLVGVNAVLSGKELVIGENVANASVTLTQIPSIGFGAYNSPDFPLTTTANVQYTIPPITYSCNFNSSVTSTSTFGLQAKLITGTYQTLTSLTVNDDTPTKTTPYCVTPLNTVALRYTVRASSGTESAKIQSLTLELVPLPVY